MSYSKFNRITEYPELDGTTWIIESSSGLHTRAAKIQTSCPRALSITPWTAWSCDHCPGEPVSGPSPALVKNLFVMPNLCPLWGAVHCYEAFQHPPLWVEQTKGLQLLFICLPCQILHHLCSPPLDILSFLTVVPNTAPSSQGKTIPV